MTSFSTEQTSQNIHIYIYKVSVIFSYVPVGELMGFWSHKSRAWCDLIVPKIRGSAVNYKGNQ